MHNEFTAIIEAPTEDDPYWIAYCAEVPGANGQGETEEACLENLRQAIDLMLEVNREESFKLLPEHAKTSMVSLG